MIGCSDCTRALTNQNLLVVVAGLGDGLDEAACDRRSAGGNGGGERLCLDGNLLAVFLSLSRPLREQVCLCVASQFHTHTHTRTSTPLCYRVKHYTHTHTHTHREGISEEGRERVRVSD